MGKMSETAKTKNTLESESTASRKSDHIRINLEEDVRSALTTGLEQYRFIHQALPEMDLDAVDLSQTIFQKRVNAPILISSMTGGTAEAGQINRILAEAAQETQNCYGCWVRSEWRLKMQRLPKHSGCVAMLRISFCWPTLARFS